VDTCLPGRASRRLRPKRAAGAAGRPEAQKGSAKLARPSGTGARSTGPHGADSNPAGPDRARTSRLRSAGTGRHARHRRTEQPTGRDFKALI
jgi:hypothetical protein